MQEARQQEGCLVVYATETLDWVQTDQKKEMGRKGRRFQEMKKVESFNLSNNLLLPYQKISVIEFENE